MTTTQGAIRRLELLLARTPDMECADDLRFLLADAVLSRAELEASESLRSATISTMRRNEAELTEARRLLDDARAQKPVAWRPKFDIEGDWSLGEPPIESIEYWHEQGLEIEYAYLRSAPVPPAASTKTHQWEDDHCIKCGDSDWYAGPICSECKVVQPAAVPEAVAKDAAAILVQALEEIAWQRPLGVRPSKSGEAMERAAIIALHKYNASSPQPIPR